MPTVSVDIRRKLSVLLAVTALAATAFTPAATAAPAPGNPATDPFYAQPAPFPDVAPGTVLDSRPVTIRALALPVPVRAWQVKYRSTDTHGGAIADVATILQPVNPPASGARKLVSYQTAQDGLSTDCAPSYALTTGTNLPAEELALMLPLVAAGYTVVTADYEGPRSEWAAAANTAHGVLDGIRATQSFPPAGLAGPATPTGLIGYSGGALASEWANELQPSYAPELKFAGVAAGGVPADLDYLARHIDGGPFAGIYVGAAVGLSRAYSEIDTDALLNARGKEAFAQVGGQCIAQFTVGQAFRRMSDYTTVPQLLDVPAVKRVIAENTMGRFKPGSPVYVYQGVFDELAFSPPVDKLVRTYCAQGVPVQYHRVLVGDHVTVAVQGAPGALAYLADRLAGKPAPSTC
ncbi:lipase family protein [Amycolatopsis rhabdoformis]|uniref:Lipase family protein n=1 Tax=Amycolatopsis rhabdoformis TaxID=1448059 RepID=A0ABZ1IGV2_9PSEU|nr:lipase family protein [Amycolatopsis rhabdoformis]WSE32898.1 lipase family protein [Amycolatopsis rhabdoformis]